MEDTNTSAPVEQTAPSSEAPAQTEAPAPEQTGSEQTA